MTEPADRASAGAAVPDASGPLLVPLLLLVPVLLAANLAQFRLSAWTIAVGLALTAALALIALIARLGPADIGLRRASMPAGLRWGGGFAAVVAVAYGVALLIPFARDAVGSAEGDAWPAVLWSMLVVIPLGTVLPEELAFRGVLWGLLRRRAGPRMATLVSSALFGVWHVLPALGGGAANEAVSDTVGGGPAGLLLRVGGTVLFTAFAGVVLCGLRSRSDSLVAPVVAHWSVNALGLLFVQLA
jgi:membrane protease YdiL (CAAX protease family)